MKKQPVKHVLLAIVLLNLLAACASPATPAAPSADLPTPQTITLAPDETAGAEPTANAVAPAAPDAARPTLDLNNLPDVPLVSYPGDSWFQPTAASQIQLNSGKVQLLDFSAVW